MRTDTAGPNRWGQTYIPAIPTHGTQRPAKERAASTARRICPTLRHALLRAWQAVGALAAAGALFYLATGIADGARLLATFAGVSALLYVGLAAESRSLGAAALNFLAAPAIFAIAYASLEASSDVLAGAFLLHALWAAIQTVSVSKPLHAVLLFWSVFNTALAVLLLLSGA